MSVVSNRGSRAVSFAGKTASFRFPGVATGILVAALGFSFASTPAQAEGPSSESAKAEPTRYAVRAFEAKGVDSTVAGAIETSFCNALTGNGADVLCPGDVKALLTQKQAQLELGECDRNERACLEGIARVSNASRIVTGEVSQVGSVFQVSVSVVDPAQNRVVTRASERANRVEKLFEVVEPLARKVAERR